MRRGGRGCRWSAWGGEVGGILTEHAIRAKLLMPMQSQPEIAQKTSGPNWVWGNTIALAKFAPHMSHTARSGIAHFVCPNRMAAVFTKTQTLYIISAFRPILFLPPRIFSIVWNSGEIAWGVSETFFVELAKDFYVRRHVVLIGMGKPEKKFRDTHVPPD